MELVPAALISFAIINTLLGCYAGAGIVGLMLLAGLAIGLIFGSVPALFATIFVGPGLMVAVLRHPAAWRYVASMALVVALVWVPRGWLTDTQRHFVQAREPVRASDVIIKGVKLALPADAPLRLSAVSADGTSDCRFCRTAAELPAAARVTAIEISAPPHRSCTAPPDSDARAAACRLTAFPVSREGHIALLTDIWEALQDTQTMPEERVRIPMRPMSLPTASGRVMEIQCFSEVASGEFACYGQIGWQKDLVIRVSRRGESMTQAIASMLAVHAAVVALLERYAIDATPGPFGTLHGGGKAVSRRILVADDDPHIRDVVCFALQKAGFETIVASNGVEALAKAATGRPALIVLDVGMPDMDGLEVCRRLRRTDETPILFLSARDEDIDRILGLELGGDDYVTKPFSPRELVARINAVLKRSGPSETPSPGNDILRHGDLSLDAGTRRALFAATVLPLTAIEFAVLRCLMRRPGIVLSREQILAAAWPGQVHVSDRTVDSHMRNIRAKLGTAGCDDAIETVHGVGFRLGPCSGSVPAE